MEHHQEHCPACGGLVHKVAGRCKHCRADLVAPRAAAARAARQAAQAAAQAAPAPDTPRATRPADDALTVADLPRPVASSPRRRRIVLVAAAFAVLGLGVGAGAVAARLMRAPKTSGAADGRPLRLFPEARAAGLPATPPSRTPAARGWPPMAPDLFGPFLAPDPQADPDALDPGATRDPGAPIPGAPRVPGFGLPFGLGQRAPAPGLGGNAAGAAEFPGALANRLCERLASCGMLDPTLGSMCQLAASQLGDLDAEELIRSGACRYDASRARSCLDAIGGIRCDGSAGPLEILALTGLVESCMGAFTCD